MRLLLAMAFLLSACTVRLVVEYAPPPTVKPLLEPGLLMPAPHPIWGWGPGPMGTDKNGCFSNGCNWCCPVGDAGRIDCTAQACITPTGATP